MDEDHQTAEKPHRATPCAKCGAAYTRREAIALAAIAASTAALAGCGGGGSGGSDAGAAGKQTVKVTGSVDMTQIGGSGLKVVNAYQVSAPVSANGTFSTTVSSTNAHTLFLMDSAGAVWGLAFWIPQSSKSVHQRSLSFSIPFNPLSTAESLAMSLPGIVTSDVQTAASRIGSLHPLKSFQSLTDYLGNLATSSLSALANDVTGVLSGLVQALSKEWQNAKAIFAPNPFSAKITGVSNGAANVLLTNSGWRFVSVAREFLDVNGKSLGPLAYLNFSEDLIPLDAMPGANGLSIGNLFTSTAFAAHTDPDKVTLPTTQTASSIRYWIEGPGFGSGGTPDPNDTTSMAAWSLSIIYYISMPLFDWLGISSDTTNSAYLRAVLQQYEHLASTLQANDFISAVEAGDQAGIESQSVDTLSGTICDHIDLIEASLAAAGLIGSETAIIPILTFAAGAILGAFCGIKKAIAAASVGVAVSAWLQYQSVMNVTVPVGGNAVVNVS